MYILAIFILILSLEELLLTLVLFCFNVHNLKIELFEKKNVYVNRENELSSRDDGFLSAVINYGITGWIIPEIV